MPFLAVGVEHTTAPLAVRERVALDETAVRDVTHALIGTEAISEAAILSTCNRTEIYLFTDDPEAAASSVRAQLLMRDHDIGPYLQTWDDLAAAAHLFRVASGLESQVLGEEQIMGQVRDTLELAQELGAIGPNLHSLFRSAISCARQARAGSGLGKVNPSHASAAVNEAHVAGRSVLIIGGGEISRLVADEVRRAGPSDLFIANRTLSVAQDLAASAGGQAIPLDAIGRVLARVDVIFSATSAPRYVLTPEDFTDAPTRSLTIYDLAIPRDVDPAVGMLPQVILHDLDHFLPEGAKPAWDTDMRAMEAVINAEVAEFGTWYLTRRVAPVIAHLRSHVEAVQRQELKRVGPQLADLTERERAAVESLTTRLIDKMFHHLVLRLRLAAQTDPALVDAAEFFFLHGEGGLFEDAAAREYREAST